jgi:hypothetical protein
MSNRFTNTEKWKDSLFRRLPPNAKLLYFYILDNCDCAGFWEVDLDLAAFNIRIDVEEMKKAFAILHSRFLTDDKYVWVKSFIRFQQKGNILNPKNNAHIGIARCIKQHELLSEAVKEHLGIKQLPNGFKEPPF